MRCCVGSNAWLSRELQVLCSVICSTTCSAVFCVVLCYVIGDSTVVCVVLCCVRIGKKVFFNCYGKYMMLFGVLCCFIG